MVAVLAVPLWRRVQGAATAGPAGAGGS
jgi:hypothetical protein